MRRRFITRVSEHFYCLSLHLLDKGRWRWGEKNSHGSAYITRGGSTFMEKEQLKVCTKTLGLNFTIFGVLGPAWQRLMMLEGII